MDYKNADDFIQKEALEFLKQRLPDHYARFMERMKMVSGGD